MSSKYPKEARESRLLTIWYSMRQRCYGNKNSETYKKYGAKGIRICDEWKNDYMSFYNWAMSNGYSDELTIDRIDYKGNYEPSNCRWATSKTQANNKSNVRRYSFNGETHTIPEWSEQTGIDSTVIWARLCTLGWSIERTLTTPVRFIDKSRTEADMEIINRSLITAAKEHKCGCCDGVISVGEKYSLLHISKDYKIISIRLHLGCENTYVDSVKNYCGNSIEKRWNKMKSVSNKSQKGENV
jgi:hypothetical protein